MKFRIKIKIFADGASSLDYTDYFNCECSNDASKILKAVATISKLKMDIGEETPFEFGYYDKKFGSNTFLVSWKNVASVKVSIRGSEFNKVYFERAIIKNGSEPVFMGPGEYYVKRRNKI